MTELDSTGRALLESFQASQAAPPDVSERVWEAVQARAAAGDLGPDLGPEVPASTGGSSGLGMGLGVKIGLGIGGLVVVAAIAFGLSPDPKPPGSLRAAPVTVPTPKSEDTPAPAVAPVPDRAPSEANDEAPIIEPEPEVVPATAASASKAEPSARGKRSGDEEPTEPTEPNEPAVDTPAAVELGPDLGPEVALMTEARAAMRSGRHGKALTLLDQHAKTFPHGVFANERELSRVTTLCAMGEADAASEVAQRYLARHPAAKDRLDKTCAGSAR